MFEAKLSNASTLRKIVEAIKELLTDAIWDCTDEGISLQAMDSSHVALVSLRLRVGCFVRYRCDRNFTLGINLVNMFKIMKCAANDDSVTMRAREDGDTITFVFEPDSKDRQSEFEIKLMDLEGDHLGIPDTEHACVIRMSSSEFSRICRDLSQLGDTLQITCTKDGAIFSAKGDIGTGTVRLSQTAAADNDDREDDQSVVIDMREACLATFALKYLITFTKAAPLSARVHISVSNNLPIAVEYPIKNMGYIRYYLAPKIDENADNARRADD